MKAILGSEGALGILFEEKIIKYTRSLRVEVGLRDQDPVAIAKLVEKCHDLADFRYSPNCRRDLFFAHPCLAGSACPRRKQYLSMQHVNRSGLQVERFPKRSSIHQSIFRKSS